MEKNNNQQMCDGKSAIFDAFERNLVLQIALYIRMRNQRGRWRLYKKDKNEANPHTERGEGRECGYDTNEHKRYK